MSSEMEQRQAKVAALREGGQNPYPNGFSPSHTLQEVVDTYDALDEDALKAREGEVVRVAGRIRFWNGFGKSTFIRIQDRSARLQIYVRVNNIGAESYEGFKGLDVGDYVGAEGTVFRTRTGELSVMATSIELLTKTVRPLPEKWHGLSDKETRYRQRYVDLMVNEDTRAVFTRRSAIIRGLRAFFEDRDFVEVETPMMHPIVGGAAARPFVTHHNALGVPLYMRIAPELYLKRLVVGGMERVFEVNRNFRNEGVSARHNPEFTMLEFYQAYATYRELMDLSEALFRSLAESITGSALVTYQGKTLDFSQPFPRLSIVEACVTLGGLTPAQVEDEAALRELLQAKGADLKGKDTLGHLQLEAFEQLAEGQLWNPTFITDYPVEVSPLARRRDDDPRFTERFELFAGGMEIANGFSELNDPEDQAARFRAQVEAKAKGDDEAADYDADYIRALEYGLPPTAGEGIGVDRLVMLLTDQPSIRDVILFPLMRPEAE